MPDSTASDVFAFPQTATNGSGNFPANPAIKSRTPDDDLLAQRTGSPRIIELHSEERRAGESRIVLASGKPSRNRDWWTGKQIRILPSGIRTENWSRNGLVLYMHDFGIPLGRGAVEFDDGVLYALDNIQFHRRVVPVLSHGFLSSSIGEFDTGVLADLWQEGFINALSLHVILNQEDEAAILETDSEIIIPQSELIEFSIVTVGADPDAQRQLAQRLKLRQQLCERGVGVDVANCLCGVGEAADAEESNMSDVATHDEEEVQEVAEEQDVELQEEEASYEIDGDALVAALVQGEFAQHVARALAANPTFLDAIAQHLADLQPARQTAPRFELKFNTEPQALRTTPARRKRMRVDDVAQEQEAARNGQQRDRILTILKR